MADAVETNTNENEVETEVVEKEEKTTEQKNENKKSDVDVEKVKSDALQEFLATLGVEDKEKLQGIVTKAKEEENAKKTDLEKANDTLKETLKQLAVEREARVLSDAKFEAMKLGARPEMVDDLVIIAKARVTKDKNVSTVIAEIKDSESGKFYFVSDEEEKEQKKANVTRKRATNKKEETKTNDNDNDSFAKRHFAKQRASKRESYYFK